MEHQTAIPDAVPLSIIFVLVLVAQQQRVDDGRCALLNFSRSYGLADVQRLVVARFDEQITLIPSHKRMNLYYHVSAFACSKQVKAVLVFVGLL